MKITGVDFSKILNAQELIGGKTSTRNNPSPKPNFTSTELNKNNEALRYVSVKLVENNSTSARSGFVVRNGIIINKPTLQFAANRSDWQIVGKWKGSAGNYKAEVVATKETSLKELAQLLTGNQEDWKLLNQTADKVSKGTKIDVSPLLTKIENDIRGRVEPAKNSFNSGFPNTQRQLKLSGVGSVTSLAAMRQIRLKNISVKSSSVLEIVERAFRQFMLKLF